MRADSSEKYILLIPDGMADRPVPELDGETPMRVAHTPNMDYLAKYGRVGAVRTIPPGMDPGSDVAIMSLLGYDPAKYYTGRGPIEAVSMGIPLDRKDVAFRSNLVSCDGVTMLDYSAGHITTEEARELMTLVNEKLGTSRIKFYPGVSYRHIMICGNCSPDVHTTPPHDITGKPIEEFLPRGDGDDLLRTLIYDSLDLLENHPINRRRRDEGKNPANMIWPWGQGRPLDLPNFTWKNGVTGAVVAAVDLLKGLGRAAGLELMHVVGATGYFDTNFEGKAEAALDALKKHDFVVIHIEAPDEAGHMGDVDKKIEAIENIDRRTLGTLLEGLRSVQRFRILVTPDHVTPISIRTHADEPVPFVLYSSWRQYTCGMPFNERAVENTELRIDEGHRLIDLLISDG